MRSTHIVRRSSTPPGEYKCEVGTKSVVGILIYRADSVQKQQYIDVIVYLA